MAETSTAVIASANNLSVRYGTQVVLDGATIAFTEGEHLGLWDATALANRLSSRLRRAWGSRFRRIHTPARSRHWLHATNFRLGRTTSVHANILCGAQRILDLIADTNSPRPKARAAGCSRSDSRFRRLESGHRIKWLITNLHAPESDRIVATLSGGEKRRVALCRAFLARPDFLILDEPTNHLDTGSIEWLEDFSRVMPDLPFCDTRSILSRSGGDAGLELSRGEFTSYEGNYTDYLLARADARRSRRRRSTTSEVFETRTGMGEKSAARATDEIGGSG